MNCVIDTGAVSWMEKVGYLNLLPKLYDKIWVPPLVFEQIKDHYSTEDFVRAHISILAFENISEKKRFNRLVRRWFKKKVIVNDPGEVEVFIAHQFFINNTEALYANKGATTEFSKYSPVRDIADLFVLAENKKIFDKNASIRYLRSFIDHIPPYRPRYIQPLLDKLVLM
jgi:hypothetical protein